MILQAELQSLIARKDRLESSVLSVYLNVNQTEEANLNRGFETNLHSMLNELRDPAWSERDVETFNRAADRCLEQIRSYKGGAKGIVMFLDQADDFAWIRELNVTVRNSLSWGVSLHIHPLMELLRRFHNFGVVLSDHVHTRTFAVSLGEIRELKEFRAEGTTRKTRTTGTDQIWSDSRFDRRASNHVHQHLKHVVEVIEQLSKTYVFEHLVLAGPHEVATEIQRLLPQRLASSVVGLLALPFEAKPQTILESSLRLMDESTEAAGIELVEELITAASKNRKASLGMDRTLDALNQKDAWQLLYSVGFKADGGECTECSALLPVADEPCRQCRGEVRPVDDLIERTVALVLRLGGTVEPLRGKAAESLLEVGGIGLFLRFATTEVIVS